MQNSKLIDLLKTFQARDFRRFENYLASPFFVTQDKFLLFFQVLRDFSPEFDGESFTREEVWNQYAKGEAFDEKEMGYLMSFTLKYAEDYLAQTAFEEDEMAGEMYKLGYFVGNGLEKHSRSAFRKAEKTLQNAPFRDADWSYNAWRLADAEVKYFYATRSRKPDDSIRHAARYLDAFYFSEKLRLGCEFVNLNSIFSGEYDTAFVDDLEHSLSRNQEQEAPEITIYRRILEILRHPDHRQAFDELKSWLPKASEVLPPLKVQAIFSYAQNHAIRQIKQGNLEYQEELFSIYQQSIEQEIVYEDGLISPWKFKNIVSIGLRLGHFDWVEQFIEKHAQRLEPQFRKSGLAYNRAHLYFHRKQYDLALKSLMQVEFSDVFYALDTRKLQLMLYLERGDTESLFSLISSFKVFLRRNRLISDQNRAAYKNFVDWVSRIQRAREKGNVDAASISKGIQETTPLIESDWLLGQV